MGWMTFGTTGFAIALMLAEASPALAQAADDGPASVAVIGFDYSDSSGEVEDQSAEHDARVAAFRNQLRDGITASERFEAVELPCVEVSGCTRGSARADHVQHRRVVFVGRTVPLLPENYEGRAGGAELPKREPSLAENGLDVQFLHQVLLFTCLLGKHSGPVFLDTLC